MSKIKGIGNDILEISRFRKAATDHFVKKIFTAKERAYCAKFRDPIPHLAVRFSGKEAIAKAFGVGFGKDVHWQDIEIINNKAGKPEVFFSARLKKKFKKPDVLIALSHCQEYVTATAVWI
ncbi:MAG: holo-ACP synthase [Verrucomicrobia bacterium]|nr:holo-ACP synthase [Verrucomicrobiota bacterium]